MSSLSPGRNLDAQSVHASGDAAFAGDIWGFDDTAESGRVPRSWGAVSSGSEADACLVGDAKKSAERKSPVCRSRSRSPAGSGVDCAPLSPPAGHQKSRQECIDLLRGVRPRYHPAPPRLAGCDWWQSLIWKAFASVRSERPLQPLRPMRHEGLCEGSGGEMVGFKVAGQIIMENRPTPT